jgi:hypothetical protein
MAARRTGSGRLMLDTGEWEALKEEVVKEISQEAPQAREPDVLSIHANDSGTFIRAIAGEVVEKRQKECFASGPGAQLATGLREVKQEVKAVTEQVGDIRSELRTARELKDSQDRAFNKRLTLIVGSFTALGVMGNLVNIFWTLVHRGH